MLEESRQLGSVRQYVQAEGAIVRDCGEIGQVLCGLGPVSQHDTQWQRSPSYPEPYIAQLQDMTVLPGSRLLLASGGQALSDEIEFAHRQFGLPPKLPGMALSAGPMLHFTLPLLHTQEIPRGIHLMGEHESNYFHWIVEILPRLFLLDQSGLCACGPLLVSAGLPGNLYALLEIMARQREIVRLELGNRYHVGRLIYPSDVTRIMDVYDRAPGEDSTYLPVGLLRQMAASIKASVPQRKQARPKKLFVRRASGYRNLLNQMEIEREFERNGFTPIEPGSLSVTEQIANFAQADVIVGPSGAALANMLWCAPGARVFVLHSDHPYKKYPYWDALARASGAVITYVQGPRAHAVTGTFEAHDDYCIDAQSIVRILESL